MGAAAAPVEARQWVQLRREGEEPAANRWYDIAYDSANLAMIAVGANGSEKEAPGPVWALSLPKCWIR
jgi:hypothetical protein